MSIRTKTTWVLLNVTLVALLIGMLVWLARCDDTQTTEPDGTTTMKRTGPVLRLGMTPERNIYAINKRYGRLADYLSERLDRPVEPVMLSTYEGVLKDFEEKKLDGAFLGSLVAVLAMDRLGAKAVVKPEHKAGHSSYHGVIFVRADSPVERLTDLAGRSIAMVKTTTAGHMFPGCVMMRLALWDRPGEPRIIWLGTHDDVASQVMAGRADVGAVKNLRLEALLRSHPEWKIRSLAVSKEVPNNALVLRGDLAKELGPKLSNILLKMDDDPKGRQVLDVMGLVRFIPCEHKDYEAVYNMIDCVLPAWKRIGIPGPPPRRPGDWPQVTPGQRDHYKCYEESS